MNKEIENQIWNRELAMQTRALALREVEHLQDMADAGYFDHGTFTVDIEQESFVVDKSTGRPLDVERLILNNTVGVRPDTSVATLEYDANGPTLFTEEGIRTLLAALKERVQMVQNAVSEFTQGVGLVVNLGAQPLVGSEWPFLVLADPEKRARYRALEEATLRENRHQSIVISNGPTGQLLVDQASNLSAMTRCVSTQLNIAYPTLGETLRAYNVSVALGAPLAALMANSPFVAGIDTNLDSSRLELLAQAEPCRNDLAAYTPSLGRHFRDAFIPIMPPFIMLDDQRKAFDLTYSAVHISSRLRLDRERGTSRIEIRVGDSNNPFRAVQALVLTVGAIAALPGQTLPSYDEARENFVAARKGVDAPMSWFGNKGPAKLLLLDMITVARCELGRRGMSAVATDFLRPLQEELLLGQSRPDQQRQVVQGLVDAGATRETALAELLRTENHRLLHE